MHSFFRIYSLGQLKASLQCQIIITYGVFLCSLLYRLKIYLHSLYIRDPPCTFLINLLEAPSESNKQLNMLLRFFLRVKHVTQIRRNIPLFTTSLCITYVENFAAHFLVCISTKLGINMTYM
jgi:hypothetical protein